MESEEQGMELSSKNREVEENGVEDLTVEDTRNILNVLNREQLIELLQEAATQHRYIRNQVRSFAVKITLLRKLFVRGLGLETNDQSLAAVFASFGELDESHVTTDRRTGKSKGYGFVIFKQVDGAVNALKEPSKRIDGHMVVCQFGLTGFHPSQPQGDLCARKIYVGNVPESMEAGTLLNLFSQYGEIEEGPIGFDKQTGRSRRYAFFIFRTVEAAKRALEEPIKMTNNGHQLYCRVANERRLPTPNLPTTSNAFDIHQLNKTESHFGVFPGLVIGSHALNHNGNHVTHDYRNYTEMNPIISVHQYGYPEVGVYNWEQPAVGYAYMYGVQGIPGPGQSSEFGVSNWEQPAEGYPYMYGVHGNSRPGQFSEVPEGSRPVSSEQSQYQD